MLPLFFGHTENSVGSIRMGFVVRFEDGGRWKRSAENLYPLAELMDDGLIELLLRFLSRIAAN